MELSSNPMTNDELINLTAIEPDVCPAGSQSYRVQRGDSFYLIARRFGVSVRALMNAKHAVIAAGGGGIPVIWADKYHLKGVPAVIDGQAARGRHSLCADRRGTLLPGGVERLHGAARSERGGRDGRIECFPARTEGI